MAFKLITKPSNLKCKEKEQKGSKLDKEIQLPQKYIHCNDPIKNNKQTNLYQIIRKNQKKEPSTINLSFTPILNLSQNKNYKKTNIFYPIEIRKSGDLIHKFSRLINYIENEGGVLNQSYDKIKSIFKKQIYSSISPPPKNYLSYIKLEKLKKNSYHENLKDENVCADKKRNNNHIFRLGKARQEGSRNLNLTMPLENNNKNKQRKQASLGAIQNSISIDLNGNLKSFKFVKEKQLDKISNEDSYEINSIFSKKNSFPFAYAFNCFKNKQKLKMDANKKENDNSKITIDTNKFKIQHNLNYNKLRNSKSFFEKVKPIYHTRFSSKNAKTILEFKTLINENKVLYPDKKNPLFVLENKNKSSNINSYEIVHFSKTKKCSLSPDKYSQFCSLNKYAKFLSISSKSSFQNLRKFGKFEINLVNRPTPFYEFSLSPISTSIPQSSNTNPFLKKRIFAKHLGYLLKDESV